jgi:hypothetical protein
MLFVLNCDVCCSFPLAELQGGQGHRGAARLANRVTLSLPELGPSSLALFMDLQDAKSSIRHAVHLKNF